LTIVSVSSPGAKNGVTALRGLARTARTKQIREFCELCGVNLLDEHSHLLEQSNGRILCACEPCAILFSHRTESGKFLRIPRLATRLTNFQITDAEWASLLLPIDLAFFLNSTASGRIVAYYPSPAGSTESLLNLDAWTDLVRNNPALGRMSPDVEALLVNRTREYRDYFIAPIDQCYKLTGIIRMHWRGLSGGDEVWQQIGQFFKDLRERAGASEEVAHA
jgi:hypothetical protein